MSTAVTSAISLSETYFLRKYYRNNQNAYKASTRSELPESQLSHEDALALRQAARNLMSYEYSSDENGSNIANSILAYVDTYNNALSTSQDSDNADISRYGKQLKRLAKEHSEELSKIGITVNSDGTMTAKKDTLSSAKIQRVKDAFHSDNGFMKTTLRYAQKLEDKTYQAIYTQLTGSGQNVNLSL